MYLAKICAFALKKTAIFYKIRVGPVRIPEVNYRSYYGRGTKGILGGPKELEDLKAQRTKGLKRTKSWGDETNLMSY